MRRLLNGVCLLLGVLIAQTILGPVAHAQNIVRVLAYPFPPFLNEDRTSGLTPELVRMLNEIQNTYEFQIIVAQPEDRYRLILNGKADMILFEMPEWNWQNKLDKVSFSRMLMKGGEVYVAKRDQLKKQSYFDRIASRKLAIYNGYHYAFANFNSDPDWLKANFDVIIANRHIDILNWVVREKADVGVITLSFLRQYFYQNPEEISKYLVSQKFAQVYNLRTLLRQEGPLSMEEFEGFMSKLKQGTDLQKMLEDNGILRQWAF